MGYTLEQFYETMSETAGTNLRGFFRAAAESTEELNYREALEWFGLRFHPADTRSPRAWLGAGTRNDQGRLVVTSPASHGTSLLAEIPLERSG